jgi:hypothetical protein
LVETGVGGRFVKYVLLTVKDFLTAKHANSRNTRKPIPCSGISRFKNPVILSKIFSCDLLRFFAAILAASMVA